MLRRMICWTVAGLLVGGFVQNAHAARKLSYEDLLSYVTDLDKLPVIDPGVFCKQFSSYDRKSRIENGKEVEWDANEDCGKYVRIEADTTEGVMAEMEGPGCIFRIWSANPHGVIRFYLDGATSPSYEWDFTALFRGQIEPFIPPFVWARDPKTVNSAADCYLPIPFAKSCKITALTKDKDGKPAPPFQYYEVDYRTFPKDWKVESFKLPLSKSQMNAVKKAGETWASGPKPPARVEEKTVAAGDTLVIAELKGPAVISELWAKLKSNEPWATRKVLLRAYWDGQEMPAIDCPIGDFFGEPKDTTYTSYPMGIGGLNYCRFPMPFRRSAKIVVVNQGKDAVQVSYAVASRKAKVSKDWALFHAKYRQEKGSTSFDYPLLEATGTGKFVGVCLFPDNLHGGWWGEGDEKVWVDGEKFPSWFGTGSEDYFGDAWGIRHFSNPSHGHPQLSVERMQGVYRWHIADNIPFYKTFRMTIENYAGQPKEKVKNDYYSVAYWYQLPGGSDFFKEVPAEDRVPAKGAEGVNTTTKPPW